MDSPALLLYRTARVAVRQPHEALVTTEGEEPEVLYITQDGIIGGTGQVSVYLMQPKMTSVRAEIIRRSAHPVCNYIWKVKTDCWKLQVKFTSPWQAFAQLAWFPSPEGSRCTAAASFSRSPGEVVVRMGPSGRAVGKATQTLIASYGSPTTYSIDINHITKDDLIVIFQPDDPTLAPVLSQACTRSPVEWKTEAVQPAPDYSNDTFSMSSQIDTVYTTEAECQMDLCFPLRRSGVSLFELQAGQQSCVSGQYQSPYTDESSPASESTLDIRADDGLSARFATMYKGGTQQEDNDDQCIVVKLLP
ncbi:hypothetical protein CH63R_10603 [Colletotrichum higginsianum IMI 349063]|uniref:Uncharacterized protein n=1 Tax=Colletotrichum higginsianum (strain IMI 349063) TaxID=759273 RepID=A0A1B7Y3B5_COLHI|nr:uncharacterized protein CH63R_10603 [Colletotrichum higginsianum IMI 349063]OBR06483.1 hypothetical protein CH63R_10603 [Colletotrichum higginsianum IMI 349063]